MDIVYGPVPSRRLGQSLGIDPLPLKTCNWNCVYCQLGRTVPLTNRRDEYIPGVKILAEVKQALQANPPENIDWVTIVGSGEPTLHSGIGDLIHGIKKMTDHPLAVITNGGLLFLPEVREALLAADAVLPSLDAGGVDLYRRINRPHPSVPFQRYRQGLIDFSQAYQGKLWLEVMLVRDLNDTAEALRKIGSLVENIQPDQVHLSFPTRPPVETWVQPSTQEGMMHAQAILGTAVTVLHPARGSFDLGRYDSLVDAVVGVITRHPLREKELIATLERWDSDHITETLRELQAGGKAKIVERYGVRFWSASPAYFPENEQSSHTAP